MISSRKVLKELILRYPFKLSKAIAQVGTPISGLFLFLRHCALMKGL